MASTAANAGSSAMSGAAPVGSGMGPERQPAAAPKQGWSRPPGRRTRMTRTRKTGATSPVVSAWRSRPRRSTRYFSLLSLSRP